MLNITDGEAVDYFRNVIFFKTDATNEERLEAFERCCQFFMKRKFEREEEERIRRYQRPTNVVDIFGDPALEKAIRERRNVDHNLNN